MPEAAILSVDTQTPAPAAGVLRRQDAGEAVYSPSLAVQTRLTVGSPDDPLEREADDMADKVMRMQDLAGTPESSFIQRKCSECNEETIQREDDEETQQTPADTGTLNLKLTEPDFLSLRTPFLDRNVPHLWHPESALGVWQYNFDFFRKFGLDGNWAGKAANLTAPFFINSQLKAGNPTWWEITDRDMNTTTISGSLPLFSFGADFRNWKPLPFIQKKQEYTAGNRGENFIQRKCAHCEEEEKAQRKPLAQNITPFIQAKGDSAVAAGEATSAAIQSSRGSGNQMDNQTNNFMSSRFGADFSRVNVHTDAQSVQLNRDLNAKAFTVGSDIYFNSGQYQPQSAEGKTLLAHELTHVVQQGGGAMDRIQRECHEESNPSRTVSACPEGATDVGRQPQGQANALDARANALIATAAGSGSNSSKALQVVNDMLCAYMPSQAGKVRKLDYFATEPGLHTRSVGSGATARGDICVGDSFLTGTTSSGISRRVLQLAHELEHIEQYRTGLAGQQNRPEREFLAFYHEALADEFIGTRRMADVMRRRLIDAALGQYNCLTDALKTTHRSKQQELLTRRTGVNGTSGNAPTNAPTACIPQ